MPVSPHGRLCERIGFILRLWLLFFMHLAVRDLPGVCKRFGVFWPALYPVFVRALPEQKRDICGVGNANPCLMYWTNSFKYLTF